MADVNTSYPGDTLARLEIGPELDWEPMRIVPPDPWTGHIPFAFWLIKILKPRTLVELGTHSGNSYFAFCQAMAAFSPAASTYAVDTWQGDEHAGGYDDSVFAGVQSFNAQHFRQFSTLLRTTFDDASAYFPDGEIDLLHIDGMHTYDAVRHDFETWQRTLSPRAVVIFHDTNVRERGFGVWRFWRELTARYPSFEFDHSNGLGIIATGADQPPALQALFSLNEDRTAAGIFRGRIAARGEAFQRHIAIQNLQLELQKAADSQQSLLTQLAEREGQTATLAWQNALLETQRELIAVKDARIADLHRISEARLAALGVRDQMAIARNTLAEQLILDVRHQAHLVNEERRVRAEMQAGYEAAIAGINADRDALREHVAVARQEGERAAFDAAAHFYGQSISWKVTRPLRAASRLVFGRRTLPPMPPASLPAPAISLEAPAPAAREPAPHKAALRALLAARLQTFLAGPANLTLPTSNTPDISIILVLYNQAELTFACLSSIVETLTNALFGIEIIIADNASTDATSDLLDRLENAKILRNPTNLHFLKAVNLAAKAVTGRHILLLNNDAQLLPGALASALKTLDSSPDIGAVGARIILPDGTLQEAGSIIWADGACTGYARGEDPTNPDVMFQRDVDYCSGAFLLTPTALFKHLNGFDERYAPAYYEETDYCVRLWEAGYRVVYDPDAAILHLEFGSSQKSEDAIRLQQANHATFAARHEKFLEGQFAASPANVIAARTARSTARRILVLEDRLPKLTLGSGYPRINRILHELLDCGAEITFFPTSRMPETWPVIRQTLDKRIEFLKTAGYDDLATYLQARREHFDAFLICRPHNMQHFLDAVGPEAALIGKAKIYYDAEALFVTRDLQKREAEGDPATQSEQHKAIAREVSLTALADIVLSVAPAEQATLQDYGAREVRLLGHSMDDEPLVGRFETRDKITFLGAAADENTPNADAIKWFAADILPRLRRDLEMPDLRLTMVGKNLAKSIAAMADRIELRGMIEDLREGLADARIMAVPTRFGAGIPHKVHQAAMLGIPMVVTPLIAGQLGWTHDAELLVAEDPTDFAAACARLYSDESLWHRLRDAALARVRRDCSPEYFSARVHELVRDLPLTHRQPVGFKPAPAPVPLEAPEPHSSRPAADDWAMAVPFSYPAITGEPRIGVLCHLYYPAIAQELFYYLRHLPRPAELMISTDTEAKKTEILSLLSGWEHKLDVRVTPNRGRDIAPKLIGFADVYDRYDLVLHLHSKVSDHAHFLTPWRSYLFETLLGSPEIIRSILDAFHRLPDLGILAPQHFEAIRRWLGWNGNLAAAKTLAARMGITLNPNQALDFPSGSMFWARPAALRPILDLGLSFEDFPDESKQLDHTLAHVIERLYFYSCERSGHIWLKAAQPALCMDTTTIAEITSPVALSEFAATYGVMLTGSAPIPKRNEPAPLMTRIATGLSARLSARKKEVLF